MQIIESIQKCGQNQALLCLPKLVRLGISEEDRLSQWLNPLSGPLDTCFSKRIEEILKAPAFKGVNQLISIYAEMSSCAERIKEGFRIEAIPSDNETPSADFVGFRGLIPSALIEAKTKHRPVEEERVLFLERLVSFYKEQNRWYTAMPPGHSDYFTLSCQCLLQKAISFDPTDELVILTGSEMQKAFEDPVHDFDSDLEICSRCGGSFKISYRSKNSSLHNTSEEYSVAKQNMENPIKRNIEEAKIQLETQAFKLGSSYKDVPKIVDLYFCFSNKFVGLSLFLSETQGELRCFAGKFANSLDLNLGIFNCTGWL